MRYARPSIKSFSESELQNTIMASASGFWAPSGPVQVVPSPYATPVIGAPIIVPAPSNTAK